MKTSGKYARLTQPYVRKEGTLQPVAWDEALRHASELLRAALSLKGPDTFGAFSCSKATNEVNYLAQKLVRVAVGTNNSRYPAARARRHQSASSA